MTGNRRRRESLINVGLLVTFLTALVLSLGAALLSALPVWSAYCLPKGDGDLDIVWGLSSKDVVSSEHSCLWPRTTVTWQSTDGVQTVTESADWRFASPLVVLALGSGVLLWRHRRRRLQQRSDGDSADLMDTVRLPRTAVRDG
jgi:hypothetical protein